MAAFIIVSLSPRGSWVSLLPFQNAIRIQSPGFVPVSGLLHWSNALYTFLIHYGVQPYHRGPSKNDPRLLIASLQPYLLLCMPSVTLYRQSVVHPARQRRVWHQYCLLLSSKCICPAPFQLPLSNPFCCVSPGGSFGNISTRRRWLTLVSAASTETWKSQLISLQGK